MVVRYLTSKMLPTVATLGVAVTVWSSPASAFFPPIPNGSDVVVLPPTVPIIPVDPPVVIPPVVPPPFIPPPVVPSVPVVPVVPGDKCDPPQVPEPGTIAIAAVGLGAMAAGALRKRLKKKADHAE